MNYYEKNKEHARIVALKYYRDNADRINAQRRWRRQNDPTFKAYRKPRPKLGNPRLKTASRACGNSEIKACVFQHYGGECVCCHEKNLSFLTIDHIENNGREHGTGKTRYKGMALYRLLKKLNYPQGVRILCFNCNIGRQNNRGICPHKGEKTI